MNKKNKGKALSSSLPLRVLLMRFHSVKAFQDRNDFPNCPVAKNPMQKLMSFSFQDDDVLPRVFAIP
jgi:hypothetical protein